MRSDDELLSHIRQEAGVRRHRRQRAMVGAAAAAVVLLLGAGALAASVSDDDQSVITDEGDPTTTVEETTTTEVTTTTEDATTTTPADTTTSTTSTEPTATTEAPSTTTLPDIDPVSRTSTVPGITLTVTAEQHPARPGWVDLTIRVEAEHASDPAGYTLWTPDEMVDTADGFGVFEDGVWMDCYPPEDPENPGEYLPYPPDPDPAPMDETFTEGHQYAADAGVVTIFVDATVSYCWAESVGTNLTIEVPIGG